MATNRLKVGDSVRVITGKDKGKTGVIEKIKASRVIIPGINLYKKHVRAGLTQDGKGGIFDIPSPIDMSNLVRIKKVTKTKSKVKKKK